MLFLRNPRLVSTALRTTICSPAPNSGAWTVRSMAFIRAKQSFITQYPRTHIVKSEATLTTSVVMINTILTRTFKNSLVVLFSCMSWFFCLSVKKIGKTVHNFSASLWIQYVIRWTFLWWSLSLRPQEMKLLQIIRSFMLWYWEVSRLLFVSHVRGGEERSCARLCFDSYDK